MHITQLTLPNTSSTKAFRGPPEDFILFEGQTFYVGDGVTLLHQKPYPNPSPARRAAEIAGHEIIQTIKTASQKELALVTQAFIKANDAIREYNQNLGITPATIDYLEKQYAATVASFGFIEGNTLYYGQINDCGVWVLDAHGQTLLEVHSDDELKDSFLNSLRSHGAFTAGSPAEHQFARREMVNNPGLKYNDQPIHYGVMTGEPDAVHFLNTGSFALPSGSIVLFYSDGFLPLLREAAFLEIVARTDSQTELIEHVRRFEQKSNAYRKEKSLIRVTL